MFLQNKDFFPLKKSGTSHMEKPALFSKYLPCLGGNTFPPLRFINKPACCSEANNRSMKLHIYSAEPPNIPPSFLQ